MIIIFGASGFVGRYLIDELKKSNQEFVACGRNAGAKAELAKLGIPLIEINVEDYSTFKKLPKEGVQSIINLATLIPAATETDLTDQYLRVNTLGAFNQLRFAVESKIPRFINTTTRFEVDLLQGENVIKEEYGRKYNLAGDHAAYVISKVAAAEYVEHFSKQYGIEGLSLRLTGLYGKGRYSGFTYQGRYHPYAIEVFIEKARKGETIEIWENETARDNLYVKDAVLGILAAEKGKKANGVYNVASGQPYKTIDYVNAICETFNPVGKKSQIIFTQKTEAHPARSYIFDIKKMRDDFGWKPQYDLLTAMQDYKNELLKDQ